MIMENSLTRFFSCNTIALLACFYVHLGTVSSIDGVLMGSFGTYREKTPWSLLFASFFPISPRLDPVQPCRVLVYECCSSEHNASFTQWT